MPGFSLIELDPCERSLNNLEVSKRTSGKLKAMVACRYFIHVNSVLEI